MTKVKNTVTVQNAAMKTVSAASKKMNDKLAIESNSSKLAKPTLLSLANGFNKVEKSKVDSIYILVLEAMELADDYKSLRQLAIAIAEKDSYKGSFKTVQSYFSLYESMKGAMKGLYSIAEGKEFVANNNKLLSDDKKKLTLAQFRKNKASQLKNDKVKGAANKKANNDNKGSDKSEMTEEQYEGFKKSNLFKVLEQNKDMENLKLKLEMYIKNL